METQYLQYQYLVKTEDNRSRIGTNWETMGTHRLTPRCSKGKHRDFQLLLNVAFPRPVVDGCGWWTGC